METASLYEILGVSKDSKANEIRRAYRNLATREHPDKGGSAEKFKAIQLAYDVLSKPAKRKEYNATGRIEKSANEEFMENFGGGSFMDTLRKQEEEQANMAEQLTIRQDKDASSHTAGFESWMRSRGGASDMVYGIDQVIATYGVDKNSYDAVPLPKINAHKVTCTGPGDPTVTMTVGAEPIPAGLEWGQVLVSMRAAPISPADTYTAATGGALGADVMEPPYVAGHDGVGVVQKVGPGVKLVQEGDWVLPYKTHMGTWRTMFAANEKDLLRVDQDMMPVEYMAMWRELCAAYRLLEDQKSLKPGDTVMINAANSTVGQVLIQLCAILKLRSIAVVRSSSAPAGHQATDDKLVSWLKSLGASDVIFDDKSLKAQLANLKFFAKPKLALDAVGGQATLKLCEELAEGGQLVIYGCISGKSPVMHWHQWVFRSLKVSGFNMRKWMKDNRKKVPAMLDALSKLVAAGKIKLEFTEYNMATEFPEALEHHLERSRNTKIILKYDDAGGEEYA